MPGAHFKLNSEPSIIEPSVGEKENEVSQHSIEQKEKE